MTNESPQAAEPVDPAVEALARRMAMPTEGHMWHYQIWRRSDFAAKTVDQYVESHWRCYFSDADEYVKIVRAHSPNKSCDAETWKRRESETQEALQEIGDEFGVLGGEPRVDGIRRVLTEQREALRLERKALNSAFALTEAIAAMLINLDEGLELTDPWGHQLVSHKDDPHRGDCTKEPFTCPRCLYECEVERARKFLAAIEDARKASE